MDQQQTTPLVCPAHTTQYIGAVIVGIIVGAGASFVYFKQTPAGGGSSYQAGWDAARARVEQSAVGGMIPRIPDDVRTISGTVTAVEGNRITVQLQPMNLFEDPALDDRIAIVIADTKISKFSKKDPEAFQSEMEAFAKAMQSGKTATQGMPPPEPFTRAPADVASIVVGDTLSVTATENIKTMKEFSASEIQVQ
ncbi:MAG: hypothetical protein AAB497_02230 [Patescibacteria group bacterium]